MRRTGACPQHIVRSHPPKKQASLPTGMQAVIDPDEEIVISHNWDELRRFMWDYVGIRTHQQTLQRAMHRIALLSSRN